MGLYKRWKLGLDFLVRNKNQIQNPIGIAHHRSFHTPPPPPFSRRPTPILQFCRNKLTISPFLLGSRRNYCSKFVPKDDRKLPNWKFQLIMAGLFVIVDGSVVYYMFSETIPYSNRTHLVFLSHNNEKMVGEWGVKEKKEKLKILPEDDPQSVRVRLIAKNLLNAVKCGLGDQIVVQPKDYSFLDSSDKSNSKKKKIRGSIEHMEVFDWEILVVEDSCYFQSGCLPGGKIYISTGDVSFCETDAEIASILAHEIGHVVARHAAETLSNLWLMRRLASSFKSAEKVINDWLVYPLSRKHEKEADYIGLLLMASAGYDPLASLTYWKKVMKKFRDLSETYKVELNVMSTHPSNEKRLEMLSRPKVMEEALRLYQERINSNGLPENQSHN